MLVRAGDGVSSHNWALACLSMVKQVDMCIEISKSMYRKMAVCRRSVVNVMGFDEENGWWGDVSEWRRLVSE